MKKGLFLLLKLFHGSSCKFQANKTQVHQQNPDREKNYLSYCFIYFL